MNREKLREIPNGSFGAIVTDPPYGIGFKYRDKDVFKDASDPESYADFLLPIVEEMKRVVVPGGTIAIFQSETYMQHFWKWFGNDIDIIINTRNFVQIRPGSLVTKAYIPIVLFTNGKRKTRKSNVKRNLNFFHSDTASLVSNPDRIERQHPCPRSVDVCEYLIENFADGSILDPFAGSGTTLVAAHRQQREFCGIEIDPVYCNLIRQRMLIETNRGNLNEWL